MPRVYWIVFIVLALPATAYGGSRDVFEGVLRGVAGELDRQQQDAARRHYEARSLYDACMAGSGTACDLAVKHRALDGRARQAVRARMRALDAEREAQLQAYQAFVADWNHCGQRSDAEACARALAFTGLSMADRQQLQRWQDDIAARALAERRRREATTAVARIVVPVPSPAVAPAVTIARVPERERPMLPVVMGLVVLAATVAGIVWFVQMSGPPVARAHEHVFAAAPAMAVPEFVPLTGDFATDVRSVLASDT